MNLGSIEAAAARLAPHIVTTPLVTSPWLSAATRATVRLKLETAQVTGSFKARGAMHALLALGDRAPDAGLVVTASAGNHGHALAWAGKQLGVRVRAYVPAYAAEAKKAAMRRYGAEIIEAADYDTAEAEARAAAIKAGVPYVSPYNDDDVIAGQGTVALEMLAAAPTIDTLVIAIGGGGLISGCGIVAKDRTAPLAVLAAEAEHSPVFSTALAEGAITTVTVRPTLAEALAGNLEPGSRTFPLVQHLIDGIALVAEDSIAAAMRGLWQHHGLVTEGAGATAVGAILQGLGLAGRDVGVIVCGANVDRASFDTLVAGGTGAA